MKDALISTTITDAKVNLTKIQWRIPHVQVNDNIRLNLLTKYKQNIPINIGFRKWNLNYYPNIPGSKTGKWTIKTSNQLEKPRYIIFGFQTDRENNLKKDPSKFDNVDLRNLKVYLNSESYPHEDLHVDFANKKYMSLYLMYCDFQRSYYGKSSEPYFT